MTTNNQDSEKKLNQELVKEVFDDWEDKYNEDMRRMRELLEEVITIIESFLRLNESTKHWHPQDKVWCVKDEILDGQQEDESIGVIYPGELYRLSGLYSKIKAELDKAG